MPILPHWKAVVLFTCSTTEKMKVLSMAKVVLSLSSTKRVVLLVLFGIVYLFRLEKTQYKTTFLGFLVKVLVSMFLKVCQYVIVFNNLMIFSSYVGKLRFKGSLFCRLYVTILSSFSGFLTFGCAYSVRFTLPKIQWKCGCRVYLMYYSISDCS